jgi:hypothetical protein
MKPHNRKIKAQGRFTGTIKIMAMLMILGLAAGAGAGAGEEGMAGGGCFRPLPELDKSGYKKMLEQFWLNAYSASSLASPQGLSTYHYSTNS